MSDNKQVKRVGIWIRVSTEDQAKGESPEHHERRAWYYAESKSWKVVEVYHLEAKSGKSVLGYSETKRMIEDVKRGHITGLIFSKLARLARNTRELLEISDFFKEHEADLISLQENFDTTTPAGRLLYTMISALAQWEREEISDRVAASVPIRAKMGKPLGGKAPFGYQWVDGKLEVNPDEVSVCKRIFEVFFECKRLKTTARILNESGYRSSRGAKFCDSQIRRIITNPTAKGTHRANYTKSKGDNKSWIMKPRDEWVFTQVEPIISEELWSQCNAIIEEWTRNRKPPAKQAVQLFAGLAHCSCGHKMYVPSNTPKYVCRKCRNKIPIIDLEHVYYQQLKQVLIPTDINEYLSNIDLTIQEKEEQLDYLFKEEQKIKQDINILFKMYGEGLLTADSFSERNNPLEQRRAELKNEIPRLQGELDYLKINLLSSDQILFDAKDLYSRWPKLNTVEKRQIIETITEKITIDTDNITIDLCYLPSVEQVSKEQRNLTCVASLFLRLK